MRDNWLPLLQIAQLAGVSWVEKCNDAIHELEIKRKAETSALTVNDLLMDLREVLSTFTGPEIGSNELLQLLLSNPMATGILQTMAALLLANG